MALVATALSAAADNVATIQEICDRSASESSLTPRSLETLRAVANSGDLIVLLNDGSLAGWAIRERLTPKVKEVGLMFVKPEFRSPTAFALLAREVTNDPAELLFATYEPALIRFVIAELGFRASSLWQLTLRSRGRFITKRLSRETRAAVAEHTRTAKPLFAIRAAR